MGHGIRRFEVYNVVQEHIAVIQFIAPDVDGLEGERALAQAGDHRLPAGLNTLGDGDLTLARSSPIEPISRRYIRTGSSVRSIGSLASDFAGVSA